MWWWLMLFWGHSILLVNAYVAYKRHMEMEGEVPISHYDFRKTIVLAKVDPLGYGAPTQRESFAVQRSKPRAMSRMINKRKDRYTYKKRQTSSAGSKIYATKQPASKLPAAKNKMGTYVTSNCVSIEPIGISATRLNPRLTHNLKPLPHLEGKAYGYGRCCSLCRWETGNKYMAQLPYCAYFNTVLCVWCNKSWRNVQDLVGVKDVLCQEIILRKNARGNTVVGRFHDNRYYAWYAFAYFTLGYIYIGSMLY